MPKQSQLLSCSSGLENPKDDLQPKLCHQSFSSRSKAKGKCSNEVPGGRDSNLFFAISDRRGSSHPSVHSQWASRNVMTDPLTCFAPSNLKNIEPIRPRQSFKIEHYNYKLKPPLILSVVAVVVAQRISRWHQGL